MSEMRCNTYKLEGDIKSLETNIKKLRIDKLLIEGHVKTLDQSWDGDASEAFKARMKELMLEFESLIEELESVTSYEETAEQEYNQCTKEVDGLVGELRL